MLEHLYLARLVPHITPSFYPLQAAYRYLHSMKMAFLGIVNNMFEVIDLWHTTILAALDLSATFETNTIPSCWADSKVRRQMIGQPSWRLLCIVDHRFLQYQYATRICSQVFTDLYLYYTTRRGNFISTPTTPKVTSLSTKRTVSRCRWILQLVLKISTKGCFITHWRLIPTSMYILHQS